LAKTLLLISDKPEDKAFAAQIAKVTELKIRQVSGPAEAPEIIQNEEGIITLVDVSTEQHYRNFENSIQASLGLFSDQVDANRIHYLSSAPLEDVQFLIQSPLFGHFILRNFSDSIEAGSHYGRIVKACLAERSFGLNHLLGANAKVQVIKINVSTKKHNAVEAVKSYLLTLKFQARMATVIANAVDELIMNAIYDAPTDEVGKPLYNLTPRSTVLNLEGKSVVEMHVGYDGQYVGISAVDFFGSLDKAKLLAHISKIYAKEEYKIRTSSAGAGIGLATVFRSGGSFFFISESGSKTEVCVFFKRTDNFREFKSQFRFISTQFYF
jgi:hypothetical protein